jgi:acetyl esterase/lipase
VLGTAAQDDLLCRRFVDNLGITVGSVDYRLAPEHPYPAPLEDCYTALTWLAGLPGVDGDRIAIGGASAGGGLAAALALLARDRAELTPVFQVLVYPMLDDRTVGRHLDDPGHRLWNATSNRFGWTSYLGGVDPDAAVPARRTDLAGLPPAWVGVGTWTCSTTRTSTTPRGCRPPVCRARCTWCPVRSTASTGSRRRPTSPGSSSTASARACAST